MKTKRLKNLHTYWRADPPDDGNAEDKSFSFSWWHPIKRPITFEEEAILFNGGKPLNYKEKPNLSPKRIEELKKKLADWKKNDLKSRRAK